MLNFSNITSFFKRNKKILYYTGFFVMLFMIGGFGNITYSAFDSNGNYIIDTTAIPYPSSSISSANSIVTPLLPKSNTDTQVGKNIIGWVNVIFIVASMFIGMLTQFVTLFLNPGWINGSVLGLDSYMKEIWILVSNVVYFIFALILIVIAFMNIIGKSDKWELKQALPKFIIGVLIVPFSWFMIQFILSISAILTVSAITLPFDTFPDISTGGKTNKYLDEKIIPKHCTIKLGDKSVTDLGNTNVEGKGKGATKAAADKLLNEIYDCGDGSDASKLSIKDILNDGKSIFSVISIYTYGIFKIDRYDTITTKDTTFIESVLSLGVQGIINLIFALVMLILLIALGLALFTRGVWLWIYAMFSPVFGLMYFFDKKEGGEGAMANFSFMEFIKLALVPVYVGAALSFGLMFIFIAINGLGLNDIGAKGVSKDSIVKVIDKGATISLGEVSLTIEGSILGDKVNKDVTNKFLTSVQGGVGTLIVGLLGIVVLWMAVMAAIKSSKITGTVVEPIASFGKTIGDLAMKSPQYLPVFRGMSAGGLNQAASLVSQHYSNKSTQTGRDWIRDNTSFGNDLTSEMNGVNSRYSKGVLNDTPSIKSYIDEMGGKIKTANKTLKDTLGNSNSRKELNDMIHKIFGDEAYAKVKGERNPEQYVNGLKMTTQFTNASSFGHSYFTSNIANKNQGQIIEMLQGGVIGGGSTTTTTGGNNTGITNSNANGTFNINYGDVTALLTPVNNAGEISLNEGNNKVLANVISQGFKGLDLIDGLNKLGFNSDDDKIRILTEIGKYLVVDDNGEVTYHESQGDRTGIDINDLLIGRIKRAGD